MRALLCSSLALVIVGACGGDATSGPNTGRGEAPIAIPGDVPVEPPPPIVVIPGSSSAEAPRIGREESRGHTSEARSPGEGSGSGNGDGGLLACAYVCRAFPACNGGLEEGDLCGLCDDDDRIIHECQPVFRSLERCLRQNFDCGTLSREGLLALAASCGFDGRTAQACAEIGSGVTPIPDKGPPPPGGP